MMWRRVLAVMAVGLLILGLFGDALAKKPPIRGKGNPTQWGDPDWPAYSNLRDGRKQAAVIFGIDTIPADRSAAELTRTGSICHVRRKHRWPSRQFELTILGRTIALRR